MVTSVSRMASLASPTAAQRAFGRLRWLHAVLGTPSDVEVSEPSAAVDVPPGGCRCSARAGPPPPIIACAFGAIIPLMKPTWGPQRARVNSRASLLSLTPPTGMPALPDPPQHTQRRDPAITSTCRCAWSARPARDVGCSCMPISHLCSLRHAGGFHERYEGAKGTGNDGWGSSCASRAARAT